jgi:HEAT repeat protein
MDFHITIWLISLVVAAISPLIMIVLVVNRVFYNRLRQRRKARADELTMNVLLYLDDENMDEAWFDSLRGRDKKLLGSLAGDLLRLVRGDNRAILINLLRHLDTVDRQIKLLMNGNKGERITACANLAYFDDDKVIDVLTATLDARDFDVRISAARALADLGRIPSVDILIDKLDASTGLRSRALGNLFRDLGQVAVPQLTEVAADLGQTEQFRILAINALGQIGDYAAIDPLVELVNDPLLEIRAAVYRSLAVLSHPVVSSILPGGLHDVSWEVRTQAALCAGRVGAVNVIPILIKLLADNIWWVRYRAGEALYAMGDVGLEMLQIVAKEQTLAGESAGMILAEKTQAPE